MGKVKVGLIELKTLVRGDANLLTENEILVRGDSDFKQIVKEKASTGIKTYFLVDSEDYIKELEDSFNLGYADALQRPWEYDAQDFAKKNPDIFIICSPPKGDVSIIKRKYLAQEPWSSSWDWDSAKTLSPDEKGIITFTDVENAVGKINPTDLIFLSLDSIKVAEYVNLKNVSDFQFGKEGDVQDRYIGTVVNTTDLVRLDWIFNQTSNPTTSLVKTIRGIKPMLWDVPKLVHFNEGFMGEYNKDGYTFRVLDSLMSELRFGGNVLGCERLFTNVNSYLYPLIDLKYLPAYLCNVKDKYNTWVPERVQHLVFKNIGYVTTRIKGYQFNNLINWDYEDMIASLITYSVEVSTANNILLHTTAYNKLTDEDKAKITAKGYNITTTN